MTNPQNLSADVSASRPARSGKKLWLVLTILGLLITCCLGCFSLWYLAYVAGGNDNGALFPDSEYVVVQGRRSSPNKILSVPVKGVILNESSSQGMDFFGSAFTYGYDIKSQLVRAAEDPTIKAVILEIDSPGGTITGSKAISDGVAYYRGTTGNPVYAHIMGMGASGGYWSAVSADRIIADHGSLIGSIGVIFGPFKYYQDVKGEISGLEGISTEGGIETYYITSGGYKDFGNPYRPMEPEELQVLQADTDKAYDLFVDFVATSRNLNGSFIRNNVKALPYGEQQALALKLIDEVGSRDTAYTGLAARADIADDYQVIREEFSYNFWSLLLSGKYLPGMTPESSAVTVDYCAELCGKMLYLYGDPQTLK
jgi:protease IV